MGDFDCESDIVPDVLERANDGSLRALDSASDADEILSARSRYGEFMRFRLTYDGELKASGSSNTRGPEKWAIRNHLSPQLEELWSLHPALLGKTFGYATPREPSGISGAAKGSERLQAQLRAPVVVNSAKFLPLVRHSLFLTCSLDILFLRKQTRGSVITEGGDLDNRMKTLLDGLTIPTAGQMTTGTPVNDPLYCLLEDDKLISDLSIRTDRLLTKPGGEPCDCRIILDVIVKTWQVHVNNTGFLGD